MSKIQNDILTKNLKRIERGSYWFGIVGRLSILWGLFTLAMAIMLLAIGTDAPGPDDGSFTASVSPITSLFYGWLFLKGRDGFDAIADLIREMDSVV